LPHCGAPVAAKCIYSFISDEKLLRLRNPGKEIELNLYTFIDLLDVNGGVMSKNVNTFLGAFTDSMTKDVPKAPNKIPNSGKTKANLKK